MYNECNLCRSYDKKEFAINDIGDWNSAGIPYIYCLLLEGNKYYIGQTSCLSRRLFAHFGYGGSEWTKRHQPVAIVLLKELSEDTEQIVLDHLEDMYTVLYMQEHGRENVRGGSWTSRYPLSDKLHKSIDNYEKKLYKRIG